MKGQHNDAGVMVNLYSYKIRSYSAVHNEAEQWRLFIGMWGLPWGSTHPFASTHSWKWMLSDLHVNLHFD